VRSNLVGEPRRRVGGTGAVPGREVRRPLRFSPSSEAVGPHQSSAGRQCRAFYDGRVIEIPTPRWTAYDAKRFGVQPLPGTRMMLTERAYTSPIWYTP